MRKRVTAFLIALMMLPAIAMADEPETYQVWILCQPDSYVMIRSSPRKKNNVEAWAYAGDSLWTDGKERSGFLHVYGNFEAGEGWVKSCYVTEYEPEIYETGKTYRVNVKQVNCRKTIGGKRRGWLKRGAEVRVWLWSDEWCVTNYGYIQTQYLEEVEDEE